MKNSIKTPTQIPNSYQQEETKSNSGCLFFPEIIFEGILELIFGIFSGLGD